MARELTTGRVIGVDRSRTALARAEQRNAGAIAAGRVQLVHSDVATLLDNADQSLDAGSVDAVLAVNVNVFWTTGAAPELEVISKLLNAHGHLHLVYETPGRASKVVPSVEEAMHRHGCRVEAFNRDTPS